MQQVNENILELKGISKGFPGVQALSDVDLYIRRGEVHALVGENGAGKSTLMKILSGAYTKDKGIIRVEGKEVEIKSPKNAEELGISIIYQELNLAHGFSVAENIYLGRQPNKRGIVSWKTMIKDAENLLEQLGIDIDVRQKVSELSIAQQQIVEIAKAISYQAKVVIMDEPTSSLTQQEISILFSIIRRLKEQNVSVIYISHRLEEVFTICDRVTVLRDGNIIGTMEVKETGRNQLISMMIGRELTQKYPERNVTIGDICLKVDGISDNSRIHDISFHVRKGEVLGFAGLVGSGRSEVMRLIFGADRKRKGKVLLNGKEIVINNPRDSIKSRIGFITEDRKSEGLLLNLPVSFNITLVAIKKILKWKLINLKAEKDVSEEYVNDLSIVTPSIDQKVVYLSGGNQQKVIIAKWLFSGSDVIIMDEPTRGIDVGAKYEIYNIINELAAAGKAILVVSSDMEEIMGISDRILVMREGRIVAEVDKADFSQEGITNYAIGGNDLG
jgi:ribose transport system ATP-binding protein